MGGVNAGGGGWRGNTVNRPSVPGSALGLFQRVVFDFEECRYVFPVGTKDIHLKIRVFFLLLFVFF